MMPWDTNDGAELTPDKVLRQLDAHRELQNSTRVRNVMDDYDENEEQDQGEHVLGDIRFRRAVVDFLARYRVDEDVDRASGEVAGRYGDTVGRDSNADRLSSAGRRRC